jgi:DNA-binding response OmpR family regulator
MAIVLLVDRDEDTRLILRAAFEARGHVVLDSADGEEGLHLVQQAQPDVIVGDFPMDVPGHSPFSKTARATGQRNPLIVSFSTRALPDQVRAAEADSDLVLLKPSRPRDVVDRVEAALARPRRRL